MLFREGLQGLLQRRNIDVVAAVGDGNEGIKLAIELRPDIILLDMRMPIIDGISVLKQLKEHQLVNLSSLRTLAKKCKTQKEIICGYSVE